jgi:polysaccharide export outer membrane protein
MRAIPVLLSVLCLAAAGVTATPAQTPQTTTPTEDMAALGGNTVDPAFNYVLGAHDVIQIEVFELDELDREVRLSPDGTITMPLLGVVELGGLTPQEAEQHIADLLREGDLVRNPQVSVYVQEFVSRQVSVQGAVAKPGVVPMMGQTTLLGIIGQAGGITDRAGDKIFVIRPYAQGDEERIAVDVESLVYEANPLTNIALQPGDIIMVPYERKMRVYVNGAVRDPGAHEFPSKYEVTLLQAVTAAGGVTERANESRIRIIRRLPNGGKQMLKADLRDIQRGKDEDPVLQENDIVVVDESFF